MPRIGTAIEAWLEKERDQLALWLPVALGTGIGAYFALPGAADWWAFVLLTSGIGAGVLATARGTRAGQAVAFGLLAAALGCLLAWSRAERVATTTLARPIVTELAGTVVAIDPLPAREKVRLLIAPADAALPARVRLMINRADLPDALAPGARIATRARLVPPPGPALPGAYDFARVAWFQRIGATGRALDPIRLTAPAPPRGSWSRWLATQRLRLTRHIQAQLAGSAGGVGAAFVTGDVGAITPDDTDAFRRSGLAHLLSISGVHVTVAVGAAMLVTLRLLALWPWLALRAPIVLIAAGVGAIAGIAYTLLSGAEVPTVRSCVAALLVLVALALGREAMTLRLVAAGALVVLVFRPEALVGPSFQLSFAAVTAIIAFHEHPRIRAFLLRHDDEPWWGRLGRELVGLIVTGLLVEAALAPIAAYHFHRAGFYGALANIVAIPLSTFAIKPAEALALFLDLFGLGAPAWWAAGKALALLVGLARTVAALPGAVAAIPSMPLGAFLTIIAGGTWVALWRTRVRWAGVVPLLLGMVWAGASPAPDLLVTGDGKHLAIRDDAGALRLLRPRAGDYVRQQLGEAAGVQDAALDLDAMPGARCSDDLCLATLVRHGRRWRLLATRSPYRLDMGDLRAACGWSDVAVSDRRLPAGCRPRLAKLDAPALAQTGGIAIVLGSGAFRAVRADDAHPWRAPPAPLRGSPSGLHGMRTQALRSQAAIWPRNIGSE